MLIAQIGQLALVSSQCESSPDDTDSIMVRNALSALVTGLEKRLFCQVKLRSESVQFCLDLLKAFCYH